MFYVTLQHAANPDVKDGYWVDPKDPPTPRVRPVPTLLEASRVCREFIIENGLGAGNWTGGEVITPAGEFVARISYNGRAWDADDNEIEF